MAMNRFYIPKTKISLAKQDMFMRQQFPQFQFTWNNGMGIWKGILQPREISPVYSILIKYNVGLRPKVWVIKPELRPDALHIFKQDNSLCLWWHKEWDWSATQDISKTIVPWTAIWLYYYELWLDTGEWLAPSAPHGPDLRRVTKE
jgi:hypothetical protein